MKNLILENDNEQDGIPTRLSWVLENRFLEDREFWFSFNTAFWPENREESVNRFMSLEDDGNIICQTVFDRWMQLELVVELLLKLKSVGKKINFHIHVPDLKEDMQDYLNESESELTPDTDEYNDSHSLRIEFKRGMDKKLIEVMDYHNIYNLRKRDSELLHSKDFKLKK